MATISERLRHQQVDEVLAAADEAADVIDALVAALEEAYLFLDDARYGAMYRIDDALALARKGG